jgi:hypothetical protein
MIGKRLFMGGKKAGFSARKKNTGKVMTADHHDRELLDPYFKPCPNVPYFMILLCLTPDDFARQRERC